MGEVPFRLALFFGVTDTAPKHKEFTWESLTESMGPHTFEFAVKEEASLFTPGEFLPNKSRLDKNVKQLHLFVLDVDGPEGPNGPEGVDEQVALDTCTLLEELGLAAIFYTTWSHHVVLPKWKFRVVVPFSRPVLPKEWPTFWAKANVLLGGIGDESCANLSRFYFGAFAPPGAEDSALYHVFEGEALDVNSLIGEPTVDDTPADVATKQAPGTKTLSREALDEFAKRLSRRKAEYPIEMGKRLRSILNGEVYAEPGERDDSTFKLACILAEQFFDYSARSIANHFAASVQLMELQARGAPTVDTVAVKIERQQQAHAEKLREVKNEENDALRKKIRKAFNTGRETPYAPEEVPPEEEWIVQKGDSFYIWVDGKYGKPYAPSEFLTAAHRDLAPAVSVGVNLHKLVKGEIVPKTVSELMRSYGAVASEVIVDLTAQKSRFDLITRTMVEAPCPVRALTPTFHEPIDKWIQILCDNPALYEKVKTWLAALTFLERACVALVITGPKGIGKTLLLLALSRIWTLNQPTTLEEALGAFNESVVHCPLTGADEHLPKDYRGYAKNPELRWHIQADRRPLKRKFLPTATLVGATRTIITSNSEEILSTAASESIEEIKATLDRYLHVPGRAEAAAYLKATDTSGWVSRDMIAEHALWLRDNHLVDGKPWREAPYERFLINVEDAALKRSMINRNKWVAAILQWLVGFLRDPQLYYQSGKEHMRVRINKNRLLANAKGILDNWGLYVPNEHCPSAGTLTHTLSIISTARVQLHVGNEKVNYREVDIEQIVNWAEYSGWMTEEQVREALSRDTEVHTDVRVN